MALEPLGCAFDVCEAMLLKRWLLLSTALLPGCTCLLAPSLNAAPRGISAASGTGDGVSDAIDLINQCANSRSAKPDDVVAALAVVFAKRDIVSGCDATRSKLGTGGGWSCAATRRLTPIQTRAFRKKRALFFRDDAETASRHIGLSAKTGRVTAVWSAPGSRENDRRRDRRSMASPSTHGAFEVDGVHTEVLVTDYGTRVLVLVTQIGKLGTMFLARGASAGPAGASAGLDPPDVRVLVGRHDDEMLEAAARRIAHVLKGRGIDKEILVSLGLPPKGLGVASLRGIVRCASEFALEALGA